MARRVFFSFHFDGDAWRTQQVRNINMLEGQPVVSANVWEEVKRKGDASIKAWIAENMRGRSCVVVLVGAQTASRPWVIHEIQEGWANGKGVLGIRIDKLLGSDQKPSSPGSDPMAKVAIGSGRTLSGVAPLRTPVGSDGKTVYASIAANIELWIEDAIKIRAAWKA